MPIPAHLKQLSKVNKDGSVTLVPDPHQQAGRSSNVTSLMVSIKKGFMTRIVGNNSSSSVDNTEAPILASPQGTRDGEGDQGEGRVPMVEQIAARFNLKAESVFYAKPGSGNGDMVFEGDFIDGSSYVVGGENSLSGGVNGSFAVADLGPALPVALGFCQEMQDHAPTNPRIPEAPVRLQRAIEALGIVAPNAENAFTMSFPQEFKRILTRKATMPEIGAVHLLQVYQPFLEGKLNFGSAFLEAEESGVLAKTGVAPTKAHSSMSQQANSSCGGVLPTDVYWTDDQKSSQAVLYAAGITIEGARLVLNGREGSVSHSPGRTGGEEMQHPGSSTTGPSPSNAFCLVRPPGHHCGHHTPNGFCLVNNVAISLQDIRRQHPTKKLMVIDFDVHHGEGTQSLVESWNDGNIAVVSLHRYDEGRYFPHTGHLMEAKKGGGSGGATGVAEIDDLLEGSLGWYDRGLIMNIPFDTAPMDLSEGGTRTISDFAFALATEELILPALEKFSPDLVYFSAGFDASFGDPLGGMSVVNGFEMMVSAVGAWAKQPRPGSRTGSTLPRASMLAVLEGGYNPAKVAVGVTQVVKAMQHPESLNTIFPLSTPVVAGGTSHLWGPCCVTPPSWEGVRKKQVAKKEELAALAQREQPDCTLETSPNGKGDTTPLGGRGGVSPGRKGPNTPGRAKTSAEITLQDIEIRQDAQLMVDHKKWVHETIQKVKKAHAGGPLSLVHGEKKL